MAKMDDEYQSMGSVTRDAQRGAQALEEEQRSIKSKSRARTPNERFRDGWDRIFQQSLKKEE